MLSQKREKIVIGARTGMQERNSSNNMDREIKRLMEEHDIDEDVAEEVQELIDDGVDEDDAVEIAESS